MNIHDVWGFAHDNADLYPDVGYNKHAFAYVADDRGNAEQIAHVTFWTEKYLQSIEKQD